MEDKNCRCIFGKIFGHHYKPVIEVCHDGSDLVLDESILASFTAIPFGDSVLKAHIESHEKYHEKYSGHVCTRCGAQVNKKVD